MALMKKFLLASVFALAVSPALADTFQADSFSLPGTTRSVTLTLGSLTRTVNVGEINLHQNVPSQDLLVWCLDLIDTLYTPYTFNVNTYHAGDVRPGIQTLNASQLRQIASLMVNGLSLGGAEANAATQLAIWKTEYGGSLSFSGLSGALSTALNLEITNSTAGGSFDCPGCTLTVLTDDVIVPNQALGFAAATPGPIAGAGLPGLLAAFGMGGIWWRRRKQAQA